MTVAEHWQVDLGALNGSSNVKVEWSRRQKKVVPYHERQSGSRQFQMGLLKRSRVYCLKIGGSQLANLLFGSEVSIMILQILIEKLVSLKGLCAMRTEKAHREP